ncbi:hypothetical protein QYE76_063026 [Lolium multiflorum]|uniref:Uncharacterized protein n=1 Tax=Lolium multiflorum TaxID=4521 RepID=A0AAD8S5C6_LOLMU|nr:hypothetical protein QYE76_063026 [Lolium multiflorum]
MENYSLLMGAAAVMKMAVEMAAVSMEKPSGGTSRPAGCRNRVLSPGSWLRDGGGSGRGDAFGRLWPAARAYKLSTQEYHLNKIKEASTEFGPWMETYHSLLWYPKRKV